ncbi:response regulator [Cypionkella sp.]|uniref:response regulator n=1 Tax=Cypionkella sp. TaxID=2811411 RepID=UPI002636A84C|nr:response regulator [Cypionkella sp.]
MPILLNSDTPLPSGFPLANLGDLPLQGVTILVVEDSRYACEALRLISQRAGARLRRAETLAAARAHLRVYRPDVVIVDLGLPDGRGEALIAELALSQQRPHVVLGTSGNPAGRTSALAAGAEDFMDKPVESFARFCATLRAHLPGLAPLQQAASEVEDTAINPDPLALQDDLIRAAAALSRDPDAAGRRYLTGFLVGLAHHAHDVDLADAANQPDLESLRLLLNARLTTVDQTAVFSGKGGV